MPCMANQGLLPVMSVTDQFNSNLACQPSGSIYCGLSYGLCTVRWGWNSIMTIIWVRMCSLWEGGGGAYWKVMKEGRQWIDEMNKLNLGDTKDARIDLVHTWNCCIERRSHKFAQRWIDLCRDLTTCRLYIHLVCASFLKPSCFLNSDL